MKDSNETAAGGAASSPRFLERRLVRWIIAVWSFLMGLGTLSEAYVVMVVKYRPDQAVALLGKFVETEDYRRFLPLMQTAPSWTTAITTVAGIAFLVASVAVLRNWRNTYQLFAGAIGLTVINFLIAAQDMAYLQAFTPEHLRRSIVTMAVSALLAIGLWIGRRRPIHQSV